jgi:UrcA family protein
MIMTYKIHCAAVAACLAVGMGSGSVCYGAQRPADLNAVSAKVSLDGLDLNSASGARVALSRIRATARQLCGDEWSYREIGAGVAWKACFQDAVDHAVARLNSPTLAALNVSGPSEAAFKLGSR